MSFQFHGEESGRKRQRISEEEPHWDVQPSDADSKSPLPDDQDIELDHVSAPPPAYPRSVYTGWTPPLPLESERAVLPRLLAAHKNAHVGKEAPDYNIRQLDHFNIYRSDSGPHANELVSLHFLAQDRYPEFHFDGVLSFGNERCYVQDVAFRTLSTDGYRDMDATRLEKAVVRPDPTGKGSRARFAKDFVEFLLARSNDDEEVRPDDFRTGFDSWLQSSYGQDPDFLAWHSVSKLTDFRTTVAAHIEFLYKECHGIDEPEICRQPLWGEAYPQYLTAIREQPNVEMKTVVTPCAHSCFKGMYFGDQLEVRCIESASLRRAVDERKISLGLTPAVFEPSPRLPDTSLPTPPDSSIRETPSFGTEPEPESELQQVIHVAAGDVVQVQPDKLWKAPDWYGYVQKVTRTRHSTKLVLLWLNKLFLSDNCTCGDDTDIECVIRKVDVAWFATGPAVQKGLFVRKKYRSTDETNDFATLQESDFACGCQRPGLSAFEDCRIQYSDGDNVLFRRDGRLEPAQVLRFDAERQRVELRMFQRKSEARYSPRTKANELVLLSPPEVVACKAEDIIRECQIREFSPKQIEKGQSDTLYDRNGTGDFFFVSSGSSHSHQQPRGSQLPAVNTAFPALKQGWIPSAPLQGAEKLVGMGLFCGGGNLDRGLEESGVAQFKYAIDWAQHALHSCRANALHGDKMQYFLGSVNDYLAGVLRGDDTGDFAQPGQVNLLAAGSPCPGFSPRQADMMSDASKRNASMVASVVSFVDFFSPEYLLLENVPSMCSRGFGPDKKDFVFQQIVASLVALGIASNGKTFGTRRNDTTPFPLVSAQDGLIDLPAISDSQVQLCPQFPEHRTPNDQCGTNRTRMAVVPVKPRRTGLKQAHLAGLLRGEPADFCNISSWARQDKSSKMYQRIDPYSLVPCVLTKMTIADLRSGNFLHWEEHRTITVMEAKRAQGVLDHEVLVGNPSQQFKIIGNSVERHMSLALGLCLRKSWLASHELEGSPAGHAAQPPHTGLPERASGLLGSLKQSIDRLIPQASSSRPTLHGGRSKSDARGNGKGKQRITVTDGRNGVVNGPSTSNLTSRFSGLMGDGTLEHPQVIDDDADEQDMKTQTASDNRAGYLERPNLDEEDDNIIVARSRTPPVMFEETETGFRALDQTEIEAVRRGGFKAIGNMLAPTDSALG